MVAATSALRGPPASTFRGLGLSGLRIGRRYPPFPDNRDSLRLVDLVFRVGKRRLRDLAVPPEDEASIEAACRRVIESQGDSIQVREGIAAVRASTTLRYAEALALEREVFQRRRASDEAAALRASPDGSGTGA